MKTRKSPHGTVLVSGGAKGIGRAIADRLADAGWDLALCARDTATLEQTAKQLQDRYSVAVKTITVDLSHSKSIAGLFSELEEERCFPTALVCNAGNYGELGNLSEVNLETWKSSFDLNFFSTAEIVQHFVLGSKKLNSPGRKKIVILSGSGLGGSTVAPGISAYACAKAALYRLVEVVHEEENANGFDINCIAPGLVKTGIIDQAMRAGRDKIGALYDQSVKVQKDGGTPPELTGDMIVKLFGSLCDGLSGRLMSARWDGKFVESSEAVQKVSADRDLLRLRRIDNDLFGALQRK